LSIRFKALKPPHGMATCLLVAAVPFSPLACSRRAPSGPPPFIGAWRSVGARDTATLHFLDDGTVTIGVSNPRVEYLVTASWRLLDSNHVRVTPPAGLPAAVLPSRADVRFAVIGDQLTLTGGDGAVVAYRKVP